MKFLYKAKDGPGKTVEGELEVESRADAVAELDARGYSPIWIKEYDDTGFVRSLRNRRISQRDINIFTRQLASLTKSRVPILKALTTVSRQTENKNLQHVVNDLEGSVRDGNMLSSALSKYPDQFPELYVNMVRSGESAGILDEILLRLAEALEKEEETRRNVQSAMAYPILIIVVGLATVFALLTFFLPRMVELFQGTSSLPLPTRILIGISDFFSNYWYWLCIIVILLIAISRRMSSMETGKMFFDQIKLQLPIVSRFIRDADIARFARTLSLLIDAGISIGKALELSSGALRNTVLRAEIDKVRHDAIQQGASISACLAKTQYFPAFVSNMTAVGEEAGRLEEVLEEVASFYEKEVERQSRMAVSLLEPILILVVGAVVGFIVAAMLMPIFKIGSAL